MASNLCPQGKITKIYWQFPDKQEQSTTQGDSYQLKRISGQCFNVDYFIKASVVSSSKSPLYEIECGDILEARTFSRTPGKITNVEITPDTSSERIYVTVTSESESENISTQTTAFFHELASRPGQSVRIEKWDENCTFNVLNISSIVNWEIIPYSVEPDYCTLYELIIYKEGQEVLHVAGLGNPTIRHECLDTEECPDNTYQFDCGSYLCCYKPDGYAHSRIDK